MATAAAYLNYVVTANTAPADAALARSQAKLVATGQTATKTGKVMKGAFIGVGVAAAATGAALFKVGQDFDDAYDIIASRTDESGKDLAKLRQAFRDVVRTTPVDFETAANAVANLRQHLDITGKPLTRLSQQMASLAKVTGEDIDRTVTATTRLFGDWSVATGDQSRRIDEMFRLTRQTGIGINDLMELMVQFGSPLRALGFSFEEAAVMFARFEREGVNMQTMLPGLRMALKNLSVPSDDLASLMKQMGIEGGTANEKLLSVFETLSSKNVKDADATLLASSVFGGRAWADMKVAIEEGRFEFEDLIAAMKDSDTTIRATEKRTRDLDEHWQLFANNLKLMVEPIARKVFKGISDAMGDVVKVLQDPKMSGAEKLDAISSMVGTAIGKAAEKAAELAPTVIAGFLKGLTSISLEGKLALAGGGLAIFGGKAALARAGGLAGAAFGGPMRAAIVAALIIAPEAFEASKRIGAKFKEAGYNFGYDFGSQFAEIFNETVGRIPGVEDIDIGPNKYDIRAQARELEKERRKAFADVNKGLGFDPGLTDALMPDQARLKEGWKGGAGIVDHFAGEAKKKGLGHFSDLTKGVDDKTEDTRDKADKNTRSMSNKVQGNVRGMVNATLGGVGHLTSETSKALKAFGVKPLNYTPKALAKGATETITGGILGHQRGGKIGGTGTGDTVPAMLESGEYVMNRKAVAGIGKEQLDSINFGKYSRFQAGGMAGLNPGISRLAQWAADRYGLSISSGLRAGDSGSYHSQGAAVDLVPPSMTATRGIFGAFKNQLAELFYDPWGGWDSGQMIPAIGGHMDHIHAAILGAGGPAAMAAKLARVMLKGPKGPLRSMGQSALDKVYKGANQYLSKQTMTSHGAVGNASGAQSLGRQMMLNAGWGQGQWPALLELWTRESGWDPNAVNPSSGAYGIPQSLGHGHPYALGDARAQIAWGLDYIRDRYGSPSSALAFHNAHNWYSKGGLVGNYAAGGDVTRSGVARVHKGERISPPGTPHVEIVLNGSMDAVLDEVDVLIDGRKAEIADYTLREGGRTRGRARQMAGR